MFSHGITAVPASLSIVLPELENLYYGMLAHRDSEHIALNYYERCRKIAGNEFHQVVKSTLEHLAQYGIDVQADCYAFFRSQFGFANQNTIQRVSKALISTMLHEEITLGQNKTELIKLQADEYLLTSLIYTIFYDSVVEEFCPNPNIGTWGDFFKYIQTEGMAAINRVVLQESRKANSEDDTMTVHPAIEFYNKYMETVSDSDFQKTHIAFSSMDALLVFFKFTL